MNDRSALIEAIEGELRRALAVTPSVEFTARLRQRVAQEPSPAPGRAVPTLAVVALASIAVWFAPLVVSPPANEVRASVAAPSREAGPAATASVVPQPPRQQVGEPRSGRIARAHRRSTRVEGIARDAAVAAPDNRWVSSAIADVVADTNIEVPMATTLESAPLAALDLRAPNEGLLEGRAAAMALSYESPWSER